MTDQELLKKYPFIAATHKTSNMNYIIHLCRLAHEQNQPATVTYTKTGTEWAHIKEYRNEMYIDIFKKICKEHGFTYELNSKVLKFDLFFKQSFIQATNDLKLYNAVTSIVNDLLNTHEYCSEGFYSDFYRCLSSQMNLVLHDHLKNLSLDWKY